MPVNPGDSDASPKQVWLKTELTDANNSSVAQTVARAYDVR
ncbi:hypothetical protein [Streptomyces sp. NPDC021622]